jgi:hypothetical protein
VVVLVMAYRSWMLPGFDTVTGAVYASPGAMLESVTRADATLVLMSTVPDVKLLAGFTVVPE